MKKDKTEMQFTTGISYTEHVKRATEVYKTVVSPQVLENKRRETEKGKIIYDEQGLTPESKYKKGQWKAIATHSHSEIKGFFGKYRFLSNFWPVVVALDQQQYSTVENAYQAAKYSKKKREYFRGCSAREAIVYSRENASDMYSQKQWDNVKVDIMKNLLVQKFDEHVNPDLFQTLYDTGERYLEETNYWNDTFWGVHKIALDQEGIGENNLGKLLMEIRNK